MRVIAHGGAGSPPADRDATREALDAAVAAGTDRETPVEAAVADE
jgi:isoaspartyl peptidase/L-asparaginase-like protein (Ntn-hydrolase superfamily)